MNEKCPICMAETLTTTPQEKEDGKECDCPRCLRYTLTGTARTVLTRGGYSNVAHARLSHSVYRMASGGKRPKLNNELIQNILKDPALPSPAEQLDYLITWIGNVQKYPGARADVDPSTVSAIGAVDFSRLAFVAGEALKRGLIDCTIQSLGGLGPLSGAHFQISPMQLTLAGWDRLEKL
jgi:hypothetical protein